MTRTGIMLIAAASGIAAMGTVQFELAVRFSGDPPINPAGNGTLMWLSWAIAGLLLVVGSLLTLIGTAKGGNPPDGTP